MYKIAIQGNGASHRTMVDFMGITWYAYSQDVA